MPLSTTRSSQVLARHTGVDLVSRSGRSWSDSTSYRGTTFDTSRISISVHWSTTGTAKDSQHPWNTMTQFMNKIYTFPFDCLIFSLTFSYFDDSLISNQTSIERIQIPNHPPIPEKR